jgi:hypothetical protein
MTTLWAAGIGFIAVSVWQALAILTRRHDRAGHGGRPLVSSDAVR